MTQQEAKKFAESYLSIANSFGPTPEEKTFKKVYVEQGGNDNDAELIWHFVQELS